MAKTQFSDFNGLLEITPEDLRPIVEQLRQIAFAVDPDACEVVRLGDRAATYGVGPKKMSEGYIYILPHKSWVNLGFYKGALLPDENNLLEGTGKKLRHIKIRSLEEANRPEIKSMIEIAAEERKTALAK